jgi:hypothetical protein
VRDLAQRIGTANLLEWIDRTAETLAEFGKINTGLVWLTDSLLRARRIVAVEQGELAGHARITWRGDGYLITCRRGLPEVDRRFAIAHEIGHTYWFVDGTTRPLSPSQMDVGRDQTIETLCNRFAAALLLPRRWLENWLLRHDWTQRSPRLELIPRVASLLGTPERAVAKRVVHEIHGRDCAIICVQKTRQTARIMWCVLPHHRKTLGDIAGMRIAMRTYRKVIPTDMIPNAVEQLTTTASLDGRWWTGVMAVSDEEAGVQFARLAPREPRLGSVAKHLDRLYVALPL